MLCKPSFPRQPQRPLKSTGMFRRGRNELDPYLVPYTNINLRWIEDRDVQTSQIINRICPCVLEIRKVFLRKARTPKATKKKINTT
jgi:hypothetical protein